MYIEISAKVDKLQEQLKSAQAKTESAGTRMEGAMAKIGGSLAAAFGTQQLIAFGQEVIALAAKAEGIRAAFERINDAALLPNLRKATRGTVSDLNLMVAAVKANNFQIPLQQLGTLLEFASRRAKETGESVDYLVDSIVTGISRKSVMILDNLGLSATRLKEALGGASLESKSIGEVTAAVAKIAQRELDRAGKAAETAQDKMLQLEAKWENFKERLGNNLLPIANIVLDMFNYLDKIDKISLKNLALIAKMRGIPLSELDPNIKIEQGARQKKFAMDTVHGNKEVAKTVGEIEEKIKDLIEAQKNLTPHSKEFKDNMEEVVKLQKKIGIYNGKQERSPSEIREAFYNTMKGEADGYFDHVVHKLALEEAQFRRAGLAEIDIAKWKIGEMNKLMDELNPLGRTREERSPGEISADGKAADEYYMQQVEAEFKQGYGREEVDPIDRFIENMGSSSDEARDQFSSFWDEQETRVMNFTNALQGAFRQAGNEGAQQFLRILQVAFQIVGTIGNMKAGKVGQGAGMFDILGTVISAFTMHEGGTVMASRNGLSRVPGYAGGGNFIVPAGYRNDSYPMMVESGERVRVTPTNRVHDEAAVMKQVLAGLQVLNYNVATGGGAKAMSLKLELDGRLRGSDMELLNRTQTKLRERYNA